MKDLVLQNNLVIMNIPGLSPTFRYRSGASSSIDNTFALVNISDFISDWCVLYSENTSDDNDITFNLKEINRRK